VLKRKGERKAGSGILNKSEIEISAKVLTTGSRQNKIWPFSLVPADKMSAAPCFGSANLRLDSANLKVFEADVRGFASKKNHFPCKENAFLPISVTFLGSKMTDIAIGVVQIGCWVPQIAMSVSHSIVAAFKIGRSTLVLDWSAFDLDRKKSIFIENAAAKTGLF
jgi:hypothetical protein